MSIDDPAEHMATHRKDWEKQELQRTERYESRPVFVDCYVVAVHPERKEATNCGIVDSAWYDWHMWIVATESEAHSLDKSRSIVAEITPRVRHESSNAFDRKQIMKWARDGTRIRVSGWLLLDPDHPTDALGSDKKDISRGTIWEIHPVMEIKPTPQ